MECFFNDFVFGGINHKVNIIWKDEEPLFEADQVGKVLNMGNIRSTVSNFPSYMTPVHSMDGNGGIRNKTFLTEQGLYRLLFKSRKPVAETFQIWVCEVIKTIRKTGKYKLEDAKKTIAELKIKTENAESNQIMEAFSDRYLVYIAFIKDIGDKRLIKIGSTKNIKTRYTGLIETFGTLVFMKAYECQAHEQFEKYLHRHPEISKHAFRDVIHNGHRSSETFLMSNDEINALYSLCRYNQHRFRFRISDTDLELIRSKEQLLLMKRQEAMDETYKKLQREVNELKKNGVGVIIDGNTTKQRKFTNGSKIQIYSEDGKTLIKTYETQKDAHTDPELDSPTTECIKKAIKERSVYRKHRWASLDRDKEDDTIQDIGETVETKTVHIGYVAMLNLSKDKIMNVFPDAKTASADRKFKNGAAISKAIKKGTQSGGHYFKMWFDCDESLKDDFLAVCSLPEPAIAKNAYVVEKLHPINDSVVQTYYSATSITKELRCGRKAVLDAIESGGVFKGYKWKKR